MRWVRHIYSICGQRADIVLHFYCWFLYHWYTLYYRFYLQRRRVVLSRRWVSILKKEKESVMEPSPSMLIQFLELGFSAAAALAGGFFIVLLIKYILESVVWQASTLHSMILQLDNRVKTMNNDVIRIDTLISQVVGIRPDLNRIARADGKKDARKD